LTAYNLGIDIGSKTIKVMLTEAETGKVVASEYSRHRSQVKKRLAEVLDSFVWRRGSMPVRITVTGSAGMRVAEVFGVPFVQEVVALKRAVKHFVPEADVILEMGGEDTKLVYLTGVPEQRMNNICAGGTGAFIEMMAGLIGTNVTKMNSLALGYSTIYPIASRCAVFAKSDVRPLVNAGARKEDIAASVLEAVCAQAVAGLSAGRPIEGKVALLGGPFNYIPALRDAFCRVTGMSRNDVIVPDDAHLLVVSGAVMSPEKSEPIELSDFLAAVQAASFESDEGPDRLPPLFENEEDYEAFRKRHSSCTLPRRKVYDASEHLFLGIDAGSTTMKVVLIDEDGAVCAYQYGKNQGDATVSLTEMLQAIYRDIRGTWKPNYVIHRVCIVGYGEDFCKRAYRIDTSQVETVAHLRAATELVPDLDFLMDIGGQDIKCFYVDDGLITDVVLNEACSSGCGSLFDSIAHSFRTTKEAFSAQARFAKAPVDLGTRCATFMDSRIKHAQKEGIAPEDIAAGVCYSTARNALYKVVREPDFSKVGDRIVVQGGAFANDALLRAFELETKTEVIRPDLSAIMGAWGAALIARDEWRDLCAQDSSWAERPSTLVSYDELMSMKIVRKSARCNQCTNNCRLTLTQFGENEDGTPRLYVAGNRCDRGAAAFDADYVSPKLPPNMFKVKNAFISACDKAPQPESDIKVGIPKVLALYESYPFWRRFFNELGYTVVAGVESSDEVFRTGMSSIPAEGSCYPSKLVYGHATDLVNRGAQVIFAPNMGTSFAREGLLGRPFDTGLVTCPLVENMGDMLSGNVQGTALEGVPMVIAQLKGLESLDQAVEPLAQALAAAGLACDEQAVRAALDSAQSAYRAFFGKLEARNAAVLDAVDTGSFPGALVVSHAYHIDPGISHKIDELLGKLGYAVLEHVDYGTAVGIGQQGVKAGAAFDWTENARVLDEVELSRRHPNLQVITLRSFGCGVDALVADELHDRLRSEGRVYAELKLDQITDLAAVRIRIRSLAYAAQQREADKRAETLAQEAFQPANDEQWMLDELGIEEDLSPDSSAGAVHLLSDAGDLLEKPPEVVLRKDISYSEDETSQEDLAGSWHTDRYGMAPLKHLDVYLHPPKVTPPGQTSKKKKHSVRFF